MGPDAVRAATTRRRGSTCCSALDFRDPRRSQAAAQVGRLRALWRSAALVASAHVVCGKAVYDPAMPEEAVLPDAGSSDLRAAADALRTRLPEPLGALARLAYNYRWSWTPGGPELFAAIDPRPLGAVRRQPGPAAAGGASPSALERAAARRRASSSASHALERARRRPTSPRPPPPGRSRRERPVAFFCAEYGVHGSLPDLLRRPRRARRRHPQGGLRPRAAAGRGRPACTATATSASASTPSGWQHEYWVDTDPDRAARRARDRRRRRAAHGHRADRRRATSSRRSGASTSAACRCSCSTPTGRRTSVADRWITSRLYVGDPDMRLAPVRAARHRRRARAARRSGIEPGVVHLNEGHAAFAGARARPRDDERRRARSRTRSRPPASARSSPPTRRSRRATTPTRPSRSRDALAPLAGELGRRRRRRSSASAARTPTTAPSRSASRSSRCAPAARANGVSRRHGEVAREMWHALWPDRAGRRRPDHARHQRRAHPDVARRARCASCSTATSARAGWTAPTDPATWDGGRRRSPTTELWAVRSAQRARARRARARAQRRPTGSAAATRASTSQAAADALDPDALTIGFARRAGDLQAARPAAAATSTARSRCSATATARCSSLIAGKAHPRDDERQAARPAPVRACKGAPEVGRRVVFLDDYDLALGARAGRAAATSGSTSRARRWRRAARAGMKSAVNGGLQLIGARRLVARGLRRHQRLGDLRRGRPRPRRAGLAPRRRALPAARARRSCRRSTTATATACRARGCAMVRASLRTCGPQFGAGRMVEDYAAQHLPAGLSVRAAQGPAARSSSTAAPRRWAWSRSARRARHRRGRAGARVAARLGELPTETEDVNELLEAAGTATLETLAVVREGYTAASTARTPSSTCSPRSRSRSASRARRPR